MIPMYELFSNVLNCEPWGMGPVSRFCERFKISKNVKTCQLHWNRAIEHV
jgi:hypothetical protein